MENTLSDYAGFDALNTIKHYEESSDKHISRFYRSRVCVRNHKTQQRYNKT